MAALDCQSMAALDCATLKSLPEFRMMAQDEKDPSGWFLVSETLKTSFEGHVSSRIRKTIVRGESLAAVRRKNRASTIERVSQVPFLFSTDLKREKYGEYARGLAALQQRAIENGVIPAGTEYTLDGKFAKQQLTEAGLLTEADLQLWRVSTIIRDGYSSDILHQCAVWSDTENAAKECAVRCVFRSYLRNWSFHEITAVPWSMDNSDILTMRQAVEQDLKSASENVLSAKQQLRKSVEKHIEIGRDVQKKEAECIAAEQTEVQLKQELARYSAT